MSLKLGRVYDWRGWIFVVVQEKKRERVVVLSLFKPDSVADANWQVGSLVDVWSGSLVATEAMGL